MRSAAEHAVAVAPPEEVVLAEDAAEARRRLCVALATFATGVTIVTARAHDGTKLGVTANSFNSVSLSPPLILVSLARTLFSFEEFLRAPAFAVNVLRLEQRELCYRFGRASAEKWNGVRCTEGLHGAPLLEERLAVFECTPYAQYDGGDHVIVLGRVARFAANPNLEPLVYYGGALRSLAERHRVGEDLAFMCGWGG